MHVPINNTQHVTGTSAGHVSTQWSAADGYARQKDIEEARIQAHEQHLKEVAERQPFNARLIDLEKTVAKLEAQIKLLQK